MGDLVKYGDFSLDDVADVDKASARGATFMKLSVGKNDVRVMPPRPGEKPVIAYWQHFLNSGGLKWGFACPARMTKSRCPVCEMAQRFAAGGTEAAAKRAKPYWPRTRYVSNVIDRADEASGPKVWGYGSKVWELMKGIRQDEDTGGDFTHPVKGFDLRVVRTGNGQFDTSYQIIPGRPKPLTNDPDQLAAWVDGQPNLNSFAEPPTYDVIMAKVAGDESQAPAGAASRLPAPKADDAEFGDPWEASDKASKGGVPY